MVTGCYDHSLSFSPSVCREMRVKTSQDGEDHSISQVPGVVDWVSAKDVPGENKVKGGASDSPVFAEGKVEHVGQVIGLVVADSPRAAQEGAAKVVIRYGHPKVRPGLLSLSASQLVRRPQCELNGQLKTLSLCQHTFRILWLGVSCFQRTSV